MAAVAAVGADVGAGAGGAVVQLARATVLGVELVADRGAVRQVDAVLAELGLLEGAAATAVVAPLVAVAAGALVGFFGGAAATTAAAATAATATALGLVLAESRSTSRQKNDFS